MRPLLIALLLLPLHPPTTAPAAEPSPVYARVRVAPGSVRAVAALGLDTDHPRRTADGWLELLLPAGDLPVLRAAGVPHSVDSEDYGAEVRRRPPPSVAEMDASAALLRADGITSFTYGSMGGYHTYDELGRKLDTLAQQHPALMTPKFSIGTSRESRAIWAVEISDSPGEPEPGESVVYFDAIHHAREPQSMATMLYYICWLLDNYGTNPEATALVNSRRLIFVPVVNPDGYVYNQSTNPSGGGGWRKSRSINFDNSRGVDLNRNYGYQWGYDNTGSSPTPSSETYRGATAWSEPETRAVRDIVQQTRPAIAFTMHSVAGRYLNPYGYTDIVVAYEYYAEFAGDFSAANGYLYGTVSQMLDYNSNGTTRDWLHHDMQCLAWTPEVGGSGFWPSQSEIVPVAQENLAAMKYLTHVSGGYADYHGFAVAGAGMAMPGDTLGVTVTLRNKGLTLPAAGVECTVAPLTAGVTAVRGTVAYPDLPSRAAATNAAEPFLFLLPPALPAGTELRFQSTVRQGGLVTSVDTFWITAGYPTVLFSEGGEQGVTGAWTRSGGTPWDSAFTMAYRGNVSVADSRYGNVGNSATTSLTMTGEVALPSTGVLRLEFATRYAHEQGYDYTRVQISTNGGTSWTSLTGRLTAPVAGGPGYTGNRAPWTWEQIPLTPYAGRAVKLRFTQTTDAGVRGDGFYFDELRIVRYADTLLTSAGPEELPERAFLLHPNYPNPFNPATVLRFDLPVAATVELAVVDLLGRTVAVLAQGVLPGGTHERRFDAAGLAGGVYYARLRSGPAVQTRPVLLLR
jgi:hypothetical protein